MSDNNYEPMVSTSRDIKQLKNNSASTAVELRKFLAEMKGNSPKEMLGLIAQSSLVRCIFTATILMAILLVACTAIPYGWAKFTEHKKTKAAEETPAVVKEDPEKPEKDEPAVAASGKRDETVKKKPEVENKVDDVLDKIGVGQEIIAPANVNPLEDTRNDLFDDLDK